MEELLERPGLLYVGSFILHRCREHNGDWRLVGGTLHRNMGYVYLPRSVDLYMRNTNLPTEADKGIPECSSSF